MNNNDTVSTNIEDKAETDSEILDAVKSLDVALSRRMTRALADAPVPYSQAGVLHFLAGRRHLETSNRQIEAHFGVSNPAVSVLLKKLREAGFVTVEISKEDKRFRIVKLTDAGAQAEAASHDRLRAVEGLLVQGFTEDELAQFRGFIERARTNLDQD